MLLDLHIGLPKCGSTTIQEVLGRNRAMLRRHGIYYPASASKREEVANTELLSQLVSDTPTFEQELKTPFFLRAERMILSNENLSQRSRFVKPEALSAFGKYLKRAGIELRLSQVTRPLHAFLKSLYKQAIVNSEKNFMLYADLNQSGGIKAHGKSLAMYVDALEPFEVVQLSLTEPDWEAKYFDKLGIGWVEKGGVVENKSLSDVGAEVLRAFNGLETHRASRVYVARLLNAAYGETAMLLKRQGARKALPGDTALTEASFDQLKHETNSPMNCTHVEFYTEVEKLREEFRRSRADYGL